MHLDERFPSLTAFWGSFVFFGVTTRVLGVGFRMSAGLKHGPKAGLTSDDRGVLVTEVQPKSPAAQAGSAALIRAISAARISGMVDYGQGGRPVKKEGYLKLLLRSGDASLFVVLRLDIMSAS